MVPHSRLALLGLCSLSWLSAIHGAAVQPSPTSNPGEEDLIDLQTAINGPAQVLRPRGGSSPPSVVYRGDNVNYSPDYYRKLGGIPPEFSGPFTNDSFSLTLHHWGDNVGPYRHNNYSSAYASTSGKFGIAMAFSQWDSQKVKLNAFDGWVYEIQPTPNMIDVVASGVKIMFKRDEAEYAAMGKIAWQQVKRYIFYHPDKKWIENPDYNPEYDGCRAGGAQPDLVGDPLRRVSCPAGKTLERLAVEFMDRNGAVVGWNGTFPLDLKAPADFSSGICGGSAHV
ncbi:Heat-labile enterotoxin, A chain [Metarhizium album ARSEF 1941]|uniref:Heat-labile enterotoxin, A chain n=1 Tax=Metarhizium album (strain ARSEF 1941) TaxID=1081103 RepID=A0A0B2WQF5_METAS|nr:Heat-labile enterotoxin, A chain [Metarhizium album ARSEF 1941]KHN98266.1 Heat-labile enterotoxin, A chain [Metarhizium album ARSEF 1941]